MEIKIKIADEEDVELWNNAVQSSSYSTIFHTWKWLKIIEKYSNNRLYPLMALNDHDIVGIYPIFLIKKGFAKFAFSCPKGYLLYLGPLILDEKFKQDKKENISIEVQKEIDRFLFSELKCGYIRIHTAPGLYDCRPFRWCGYQILPQYTYRINLAKGANYIWEQFDRKLRVSINRANRESVIIKEGNEDDLKFVYDSIQKRYEDQGLKLFSEGGYLLELNKEFSKNLKILVAYYKGEKVGGIVFQLYKNIMYLWVGSTKTYLPGIAVNDLIQWEAIKWACDNNFSYYENMGSSDVPRFRSSKAKYNAEPLLWFTAIKQSSYFYGFLYFMYSYMMPKIQVYYKKYLIFGK